jgi:hypothetical protein
LISRRYFEIYQLVGNISIDGFKRERYIVRIKDISDELIRAYRALNEEEVKIETQYTLAGGRMDKSLNKTVNYSIHEQHQAKESYSTEKEYQNHQQENEMTDSYMASIELISSLLLDIETLEQRKK